MARNFLKRFIPTPETIKQNPALRLFEKFLHDPNLFHLNRHSVSVAFFWGILIAILPIPGQMPVAALAALIFRCNLPIAVALAWITNPFTTPFFLVLTYHVGAFILQSEPFAMDPKFTFEWVTNSLGIIWKPLLLGSLITGIAAGALGYCAMRIYWRWSVTRAWVKRKQLRAASQNGSIK